MSLPVVSDSLNRYLSEVDRYPVLSAEDEHTVAERYHRFQRVEDAHTLVTANLRYVVKVALEYRDYGCRITDLIQEGNIGLMVAVKKFDPKKGFRLITYATWWIRAFIQDFILKTRGLVRRGTKSLKRKLFYRKDHQAIPAGASREAASEYAADSGFDLSLDAAIDDRTTHMDLLQDAGPGQEELVATREEDSIVKEGLVTALTELNEKERMVIEKRVMADEPLSLQSLGDRLGVTRERVRQIEGQALKKLRQILSGSARFTAALPAKASC